MDIWGAMILLVRMKRRIGGTNILSTSTDLPRVFFFFNSTEHEYASHVMCTITCMVLYLCPNVLTHLILIKLNLMFSPSDTGAAESSNFKYHVPHSLLSRRAARF